MQSITNSEADIRLQTRADEASGSASNQNPTNIHRGGGATEQKVGHIDWVKCPICEKSIRGDVINTHLGEPGRLFPICCEMIIVKKKTSIS